MPASAKIVVWIATSADGFIARPDGSFDWLDRPRPKGNYGMGEFYKSIDTVLWGRKTYDLALEFQKKGVAEAAFDSRFKNYIFSKGPRPLNIPSGVEFVPEPIRAFAGQLKSQERKDIWMMSGSGIIGSFLDAGEIDEFVIHVIPKFTGEGIPLIASARRTVSLDLLSSTQFPDGVVKLHYSVHK